MFNNFNFAPHRECFIKDSVLYVKNAFGGGYRKIAISPTKFFKEHTSFIDTKRNMPTVVQVAFQLEDDDGYLIIGCINGTVNVIKDGQIIGYTTFDPSELKWPSIRVGYHRRHNDIHDVFVDEYEHDLVFAYGTDCYAQLSKPWDFKFYKDPESMLSTALSNIYRCSINVTDAYFIAEGGENDGLQQRCMETYERRGTTSISL